MDLPIFGQTMGIFFKKSDSNAKPEVYNSEFFYYFSSAKD